MPLALPPDRDQRDAEIEEAERRINAALARFYKKVKNPQIQDSPSRGLPVGRFMRAQEVFRQMAENPLDLNESDEELLDTLNDSTPEESDG